MVGAAVEKARPAIYRWVPYVLVIVAASLGAYLSAQQAIDRTATIAYYNAVDACRRGNLILAPAHDFFAALSADYPNNDPAVTRAAREARDRTYATDCLVVIEKVGPADDYVPPEER